MLKKVKNQKWLLIFLFVYFIASSFFISKYLVTWDSGQFALGAKHFDMTMHQPHPPGYILFVSSAGLLQNIGIDTNLAFIIIVWLASLAALIVLYSTAKIITQSKKGALLTILIASSNPLFIYYHNIALTYIFDFLGVILALNLAIRSIYGTRNYFVPSCLATAILAGFRPSLVLVGIPILVIHWLSQSNKLRNLFSGAIIFLAGIFIWLAPLAYLSGGWHSFYNIVSFQFNSVTGSDFNAAQFTYFFESLLLALNVSIILIVFYPKDNFNFWKKI